MKQAAFPIHRLQTVREDLQKFSAEQALNGFQRWIIDSMYTYLEPDIPFEAKSMIITAAPIYAHHDITFTVDGVQRTFPSFGTVIDPEDRSKAFMAKMEGEGVRLVRAKDPPLKRLAVCSGLAEYGRNNIAYVPGMGSFHNLAAYFCDQPCKDDPWREITNMACCTGCERCVSACPTGAILRDRFLINNDRCITAVNEEPEPLNFPDWIPKDAHNAVVMCFSCQRVCPVDAPFLFNVGPAVSFDEEETTLLLSGTPFDQFSSVTREKLLDVALKGYLPGLPRNIKALLAQ